MFIVFLIIAIAIFFVGFSKPLSSQYSSIVHFYICLNLHVNWNQSFYS